MYGAALARESHMLSNQGLMRTLFIYKSTNVCRHTLDMQARPCMLSATILV